MRRRAAVKEPRSRRPGPELEVVEREQIECRLGQLVSAIGSLPTAEGDERRSE